MNHPDFDYSSLSYPEQKHLLKSIDEIGKEVE